MEFKELEKSLYLINYWDNGDETNIDKILNQNINVRKEYSKPFDKELNSNLLHKDTYEAKKDLIKHYIFEFFELQGFYMQYDEILNTGSICNYTSVLYEHTNKAGKKRKLNKFENYVVNSNILFDMLFNEIQLCCIKYKIDFFKVCDELNFSTSYFFTDITLIFDEKQGKNTTLQQKETEIEKRTEKRTDNLKAELGKYGFFELPKVKLLSESNKQRLFELISTNQMPYGIAMFDYLGFCEYLDREKGAKYKTNNILSRLYNKNAKDGTSARHYRCSLIKPTPRYKAGEYKETVKKDYQKLK